MGVGLGFGVVGLIIGWIASPVTTVRVWVAVGSAVFGLLLYGFSFGQGFIPVELQGDERVLSWSGERFAWSQIGSCVAEGTRLELRGKNGAVIASLDHLEPEAAAWTARLVEASLEE